MNKHTLDSCSWANMGDDAGGDDSAALRRKHIKTMRKFNIKLKESSSDCSHGSVTGAESSKSKTKKKGKQKKNRASGSASQGRHKRRHIK